MEEITTAITAPTLSGEWEKGRKERKKLMVWGMVGGPALLLMYLGNLWDRYLGENGFCVSIILAWAMIVGLVFFLSLNLN